MKVKPHLFSLSENLDSFLAAGIGFALIQIFSKHSGIGVSPDSVTYISAARHMVHGQGFNSFDNLPVVDFPFGYPLFLTIISFFARMDPLQSGPVLNGILFGMLLYVAGGIMNGFDKPSGWYKRILLTCILFSPAIQEVYSQIWSETIFLLLILLFVVSISNYLRKNSSNWLFISIGICSLTCLTRYAGVFLLLTGLILIFFNRKNAWHTRITHCFIFGSLSVSLLLINVVRNLSLTGLTTGQREKSMAGIFKIMEYFGGVLCDWLLLDKTPGLALLLTSVVLLLFSVTIYFISRVSQSKYRFEYVMAVMGLTYSLFMLFTSTLTRYDQFTNRLLSPVFIPLLWCLSWWIPGFISRKSFRMKWVIGIPVLLSAAVFLNRELVADYEYYDGVKDAGIPGYQEDPFVQSEITEYLKKNIGSMDPGFAVYSNAGEAYYFITDRPAFQLPFGSYTEKLHAYYDSGNNYLVWFRDLDNPEMPSLSTILQHKNMVLLKQFDDGAIYVTK